MTIGEFREQLASSRLEAGILSACLRVTDLLASLKPGDGRHLGLPFFYDRITDEKDRLNLLPALSILCTRRGAILEIHGYLDDKIEGQLHLSSDEFRSLLSTGNLAHPSSGDIVPDPMKNVRIFYSLKDGIEP